MKKIAIVAGGFSSEHDVSLRSAQGILDSLDKERFDAFILELPKAHDKATLLQALQTLAEVDYAYITIHGTPGENGLLQGYLQMLDIPFNCCPVLPAALTFNKFTCNHYLAGFGIHTAKSVLLRKGEPELSAQEIIDQIGLPCFIKSNVGGSSFGCTKVKSLDAVRPAIELAFQEGEEVICESLLTGTEITCGAYRGAEGITALPITEVVSANEFFDYDAKYNGQVQEITPARIPEGIWNEVQALTKRIYSLLGCRGIIRIDYILTPDTTYPNGYQINLLEVNTTPGMTPTSFIPQQIRAAGKQVGEVLKEIIHNS